MLLACYPAWTLGRTTTRELRLNSAKSSKTKGAQLCLNKVIYKEGRDIVEENELSYSSSVKDLDDTRMAFRELNRKLRKASFDTLVEFEDE